MEIIQKKTGDDFEITLDNRGSSGLSMMYKIEPEGIVSIHGPESQRREHMMPGDSIKVKYRIHAIKPGLARILFYETQIWDKNFPPLPVKEFVVNVND